MKFLGKIFIPMGIIIIGLSYTGAYLSDSETVVSNTFSAGTWESETKPAVVINELMWMGSAGKTSDEWLELRNMSAQAVDISGWQLTNSNPGHESYMMTIASGSIPANGYFLISNLNEADSAISVIPNLIDTSLSLSNSKLKIKLYSGDWTDSANLVDIAGDGDVPLAGVNKTSTPKEAHSMSRISSPLDGTLTSDWYSDLISNSTLYWDSISGNYGTPGGPNV